jgi:hypothetical protein
LESPMCGTWMGARPAFTSRRTGSSTRVGRLCWRVWSLPSRRPRRARG